MRRRVHFVLLVLVLILALPGFVANAAKRLSRQPRGFATRGAA
jgi:hypothetical protein